MAEEMAAGAWAGLVGTVLGYPLDVVKGRMQTGKGIAESGAKASFGRTFVNMARTEGVAGMYRGLGPPVCMMMVMNSMNFGAFYWARDKLAGPEPVGWGTEKGGIDWRVVAAATSVGPLCAMVSTPFELVKLQVQLDAANHSRGSGSGAGSAGKMKMKQNDPSAGGYRRKYSGSAHAARALMNTYGPRVFMLGHGVNTVRECVFNAVFFSTFEHVVHGFRRDLGVSQAAATAIAGGVAGAAGWLANLPLDCVKSGVQGQCLGGGGWNGSVGKVGFVEAARGVMGRGGFGAFFAGATPSLVRSFIVSGSRFTAFTGAMGAFQALREQNTSLAELSSDTGANGE